MEHGQPSAGVYRCSIGIQDTHTQTQRHTQAHKHTLTHRCRIGIEDPGDDRLVKRKGLYKGELHVGLHGKDDLAAVRGIRRIKTGSGRLAPSGGFREPCRCVTG